MPRIGVDRAGRLVDVRAALAGGLSVPLRSQQPSLTPSPGGRSSRGGRGTSRASSGATGWAGHRSVPRGVRALSPTPGRPGHAGPCDGLTLSSVLVGIGA